MKRNKICEGEMALCRSILVVSLRDLLSGSTDKYTQRCKKSASQWLDTLDERSFSFSNVMLYLYGEEANDDMLRVRLKRIFKDRRVKGTRNLMRILTELKEQEAQE